MYGPPCRRGPGQRRGASSAQGFSPRPNQCRPGLLSCRDQKEHDQIYRIYLRAIQSFSINSPQELEGHEIPGRPSEIKARMGAGGADVRVSHFEHFGFVSPQFLQMHADYKRRQGTLIPFEQRHRTIPRATIEAVRAIGEGGGPGQVQRGSMGPGQGYGSGSGGPARRGPRGGGRGGPYGAYEDYGEDDYDEESIHQGPAHGYAGGGHGRASQPYGGTMAGARGRRRDAESEEDYDDGHGDDDPPGYEDGY